MIFWMLLIKSKYCKYQKAAQQMENYIVSGQFSGFLHFAVWMH